MTRQNRLLDALDAVLFDSRLLGLASSGMMSITAAMHTSSRDTLYDGTPWSMAMIAMSVVTTVLCIQNTQNHIRRRWPGTKTPAKTGTPGTAARKRRQTAQEEATLAATLAAAALTTGLSALVGDATTLALTGCTICQLLNIIYMDGRTRLEVHVRASILPTLQDLQKKFRQGRVIELPTIKRIETERNERHEVTAISGETTHPDGTRTTLEATIAPDACSGRNLASIKLVLGPISPPRTTAQLVCLNEDFTCWIGKPYKTPKRGKPPTLTIRRTAASTLLEAIGQGPVILTNGTATCGVRLPPADRTTVEAFRRKHAEEAGD